MLPLNDNYLNFFFFHFSIIIESSTGDKAVVAMPETNQSFRGELKFYALNQLCYSLPLLHSLYNQQYHKLKSAF